MKNDKILITGATGFIGNRLAKILVDQRYATYGTYLASPEETNSIKALKLIHCDVTIRSSVERVINKIKPAVIYHLAAQSYPTVSWKYPHETFAVNVTGAINVLEAVRQNRIDASVILACSSAEYGDSNKGTPLKESDPLLPVNPYGISKVAADLLGYQYFRNYGTRIVRTRIFGTIGPRKKGDFLGDFCEQIAKIEAKLQKPIIRVGNLNTYRDLTDVSDTVRGLQLLSKHGRSGEAYNICSGKRYRIGNLLNLLLKLSSAKILVKHEKSRFRPTDEKVILGSNKKIHSCCGWQPTVTIKKTLEDTLNYWRKVYHV